MTVYPLMTAVAKGDIEIIKLLLKNNSLDINVTDTNSGVNAFWLACLYNQGSIMKELANSGIDIYNSNHQDINALHLSVLLNNVKIVKMLIASNYSLEFVTNKGYNVVHLCSMLNRTEILNEIIKHLTTK